MWWRRNLYSGRTVGPSLTWGPRWHLQTQRAAPAHLHTNLLVSSQQTPKRERRVSLQNKSCVAQTYKNPGALQSDKNLAHLGSNARLCSFKHVIRWRTSIFSLPCGDIQGVSCALQQSLKRTQTQTKTSPELQTCLKLSTIFDNNAMLFTLIFASSGPLLESCTLLPCFSRCLYVFMTPQRKALLFYIGKKT